MPFNIFVMVKSAPFLGSTRGSPPPLPRYLLHWMGVLSCLLYPTYSSFCICFIFCMLVFYTSFFLNKANIPHFVK